MSDEFSRPRPFEDIYLWLNVSRRRADAADTIIALLGGIAGAVLAFRQAPEIWLGRAGQLTHLDPSLVAVSAGIIGFVVGGYVGAIGAPLVLLLLYLALGCDIGAVLFAGAADLTWGSEAVNAALIVGCVVGGLAVGIRLLFESDKRRVVGSWLAAIGLCIAIGACGAWASQKAGSYVSLAIPSGVTNTVGALISLALLCAMVLGARHTVGTQVEPPSCPRCGLPIEELNFRPMYTCPILWPLLALAPWVVLLMIGAGFALSGLLVAGLIFPAHNLALAFPGVPVLSSVDRFFGAWLRGYPLYAYGTLLLWWVGAFLAFSVPALVGYMVWPSEILGAQCSNRHSRHRLWFSTSLPWRHGYPEATNKRLVEALRSILAAGNWSEIQSCRECAKPYTPNVRPRFSDRLTWGLAGVTAVLGVPAFILLAKAWTRSFEGWQGIGMAVGATVLLLAALAVWVFLVPAQITGVSCGNREHDIPFKPPIPVPGRGLGTVKLDSALVAQINQRLSNNDNRLLGDLT